MAKRLTRGGKSKDVVFLPDHLDQVTAIAMRGSTDEEMAAIFGIKGDLITKWRKFYPSFKEAIDKGRTKADVGVVRGLYQNAVGFNYEEDHVTKDGDVVTVKKFAKPDTVAQKYWLNNRQPEYWGDKVQMGGDRSPGAKPIGLNDETKRELMSSILALIRPKPDGDPKARA